MSEKDHAHHSPHSHGDVKNIQAAFFLNLLFTIIEFVGGFLTNSMAIISDAVHDLGDSFSLGLSWYFQKVAKRSRNDDEGSGHAEAVCDEATTAETSTLIGAWDTSLSVSP